MTTVLNVLGVIFVFAAVTLWVGFVAFVLLDLWRKA